jgi:hypothetical protein
MFTGVFGALLGGVLLKWLPLRTPLARARCSAWAPTVQASAGPMKWAAKRAPSRAW